MTDIDTLYQREGRTRRLLLATTALVAALSAGTAFAEPTGAEIAAGHATVATSGARTSILQKTDRAIIDWRSFSIGEGESVVVDQPGRSSVLLNRVTGNQASVLNGSLTANGQVMLVNPNGVMIGKGGIIDVGGFLATTADIRNEDFMAGRYRFSAASGVPGAAIRNHGIIRVAEDGFAVLSAAMVSNTGLVQARLGRIVLAGVETFTLDLIGDGRLRYQMGPVGGGSVDNSGTLSAQGGDVLMTARAVKDVLQNVINNDGVVEATAAREVNGQIRIVAEGGDVAVSGKLDASSATGKGGAIDITGRDVTVTGATIDASGAAGGGTVRIGGDAHGEGSFAHAQNVAIDADSTISADAKVSGNGGKIVAWSDGDTSVAASLSVRGGEAGGDGGFIETSAKNNLGVSGRIVLDAPKGIAGTWLLDPNDVTISDGSNTGVTSGATVTVGTLEAVSSGTITITAADSITVANLTGDQQIDLQQNVSLSLVVTSGTISFTDANDGIVASGSGSLSMTAGGTGYLLNIGRLSTFSGDITLSGGTGASGQSTITLGNSISSTSGSVDIRSNNNTISFINTSNSITVGGNGTITLWGSTSNGAGGLSSIGILTSSAGAITLKGADGASLSGAVTTSGGLVDIDADSDGGGGGGLTLAVAITTNGGNVKLNTGDDGITLNSTIDAGAGTVLFDRTGTSAPDIFIGANAGIFTSGAIPTLGATTMTSGGNLRLRAGSVDLSGASFTSANLGTITLEPYNAAATIAVNGTGASFNIDSSTMSQISAFGSVIIGRTDGTGAITLGSTLATYASNLTLRTGGSITQSAAVTLASGKSATYSAGGAITMSAALTAPGGISLTAGSGITTTSMSAASGSLTVSATGDISASGAVTLGGSGTLTSTGNLSLTGGLTAPSGATLTANGTITLGGTISMSGTGVNLGLKADTIDFGTTSFNSNTQNDSVTLEPYTVSNGILVGSTDASSSTLDISSSTLTTKLDTNFNSIIIGRTDGTGQISIPNSVTLTTAALTLRSGGGAGSILQSNAVTLSSSGKALSYSAGSGITLAGNVTTNGGSATFGSNTTLQSSGTITVATSGGNVAFSGTLDSTANVGVPLTVNAGAGAITFSGAVGTGGVTSAASAGTTNQLGQLSLTSGSVSIGSLINTTNSLSLSQTVSFTGATTGILSGGDISLSNTVTYANSSSGSVTYRAVSLTLGGTQTSAAGTVSLEPAVASTAIGVNGSDGTGGAFDIDSTLLGKLSGFGAWVFGRSDGSGAITMSTLVTRASGSIKLLTPAAGGSITLTAALTAPGGITLQSGGNIDLNAAPLTTTASPIMLQSRASASTGTSDSTAGEIYIRGTSDITSNGGSITLGGSSDISTGYARAASVANGGINDGRGVNIVHSTVNAGGGSIIIRGQGADGVNWAPGVDLTAGTVRTSSSGTITITGVGGSATMFSAGVNLYDGSSVYNTGSGAISLIGTSSGSGSNAYGLSFDASSGVQRIYSTGNGAITISALGSGAKLTGTTTSGSSNVAIGTDGSTTYSSAITLTGDAMSLANITVATNGAVTLQNATSGRLVDVGSSVDTTSNTLEISTSELSQITAGSLVIGSSTAGALNLSQALSAQTSGTLTLIGGGITQSSGMALTTGTLRLTSTGGITLREANSFSTLGPVSSTGGSVSVLRSGGALSVSGAISAGANSIDLRVTGGNLTLASGSSVTTTGTNDIVLSTDSNFINSGTTLSAGRKYLIYSTNPGSNTKGTLPTYANLYNTTYAGSAPSSFTDSTSRLIYSYQPTVTVTASANSKTYGDSDPTFTYSTSGLLDIDTVSTALSGSLSRTSGENVGDYTINSGLTSPQGYNISLGTATFTINKAPLTITATSATKVYGGTDAMSFTAGTLKNSDTLATAVTGALERATGENVGSYAISLGTLTSSNYTLTLSSSVPNFTITQAPLTLTPTATSKTYGDSDPTLTYTFSGLVNGDLDSIVTGSLSRATGENAGTYAFSTGTVSAGSNYSVSVSANFTINKKALSVTPTEISKIYGETDLDIAYTATGFKTGETSSVLSGALARTAGEAVGTYTINVGTLTSTNYSISLTANTFTINRAVLTVTATSGSTTKVYGDSDPVILYTVTGLRRGDSAGSALTGDLSRASGENVGSYAVTTGTLAAPNYELSVTSANFTITKAPLTITPTYTTREYGGTDTELTFSTTGLKFSDTVKTATTGGIARVSGSNAGKYAMSLGTLAASNYSLTLTPTDFVITPAPVTIAIGDKTKIYGDADPSLESSVSGFKNGDTFSGSLTRDPGENSGVYQYRLGTFNAGPNYTVSMKPASLSIREATLTITPTTTGKLIGEVEPELKFTAEGFKRGESMAILDGTLARAEGETAGKYNISIGSLHDPNNNYKFVLVPKQFSISKGVITITGVDASKVYGSTDPTFSYTVSAPSTIANPQSLLSGSLARSTGEDVGSYSLAIGTLSAGDAYELKFSGGNLTITPATLTVTPNGASKVYGGTDPALTYAISGLQRGDTSSIVTGSLSRASGSNVGSYAVDIGSLSAGKNYKVELGGGAQLTITPAQLTVAAQPATKIYGESDPTINLTATGLVNGDTVGSAVTGTPGRASGENVGSYSINQGSVAAVGGNYTISFSNGASLTITQRPLTVTADDKTRAQRTANPAFTLSYSGLANGDSGSVVIGVQASANAADAPGSYPIVLSGGSATNYALTLVNGTLTVTPSTGGAAAPPVPPALAEAAPITAVTNTTSSTTSSSSSSGAGGGQGGGSVGGSAVTAALAPPPPTTAAVVVPPSPTAPGSNSPIAAPTPQAASLSAADSIRSAASGMSGDDGGGSSEVIPGLLNQTPRIPVAVPEGTPGIEQNFPSLGRGYQ